MDTYTNKKSSWRRKPATGAQLDLARKLRIEVADGAKADDLSRLIDAQLGSSRIDPIVTAITTGRSGK